MDYSTQEKLAMFQNLFRSREDVFAVRWQKADGTAHGYTPVCANEWRQGVCLKLENKNSKCAICLVCLE